MKLNDFKKIEQQINEGFWDTLIGDKAVASIKSPFTGATSHQQLVQDIFIKDFMGDAISALNTGVKSGLIDPKARSLADPEAGGEKDPVDPSAVNSEPGTPGAPASKPGAPDAATTTAQPAKPGTTQKPGTSAAVAKYNQQKQTTQNMNQYIQGAAKTINSTQDKAQKIALTKELVNYMADRKGSPEWDNGFASVQSVIKKGNVDPKFANAALAKMKAGQTMAEAWKIFYINKLLESVNLTWKDIGLSVLKESTSKHYIIVETKYYKLNHLFESILNEAVSIENYMKKWFAQYMQGVDYSEYSDDINKLIKRIEQNYPKIKPDLTQLARMAFSISKGAAPGASDERSKMAKAQQDARPGQPGKPEQPEQPAQKPLNSKQMQSKIASDLAQLAKTDKRAYDQMVKKLQGK